MMPLIIHEQAEAELDHEVAYYENINSGLGLDFLTEVEHAFTIIQEHPERWQQAKFGTRKIPLRRFPHTIFYRPLADAIWVVAIAPQKRRPYYWRQRDTNP